MVGIVPIEKFDKAFRVVNRSEVGAPIKVSRIGTEGQAQRKDWAKNQVMLLIANRSIGEDDCGVIDNKVVSTATIRPYLVEAAKSQGVTLGFRNVTLVNKRTKAMRGTSKRVTLVWIADRKPNLIGNLLGKERVKATD